MTQGVNFNPSVDNSKFAQICTNMKTDGIAIYTVAFDVTDSTVKTLLKNCASSPSNYFTATDTASLTTAFHDIAISININNLRISQ